MFDSFLSGSNVNLVVAFVAGFFTFFASCLLPLVPTYLAYLSGIALNQDEVEEHKWQLVKVSLFFVAGFISVFVTLGALVNRFAAVLVPYRTTMQQLGGLLFVILGLFMMGLFNHKWLVQERRLEFGQLFNKYQTFHAFLTGMAFGFGWTPCIGPVLAVILFWASQVGSFWQGVSLLFVYGLGLGLPFVIVAGAFDRLMPLLRKNQHLTRYISIASGLIIILAGVLLASGQFSRLSLTLLNIFGLETLAK